MSPQLNIKEQIPLKKRRAGMNEKSVLAVIAVLLCCCLSFGNGNQDIMKARSSVRRCYQQLIPYSKGPNILHPRSTIFQHITELKKKKELGPFWLQARIGYSPWKLSNPPESYMRRNELKLATECHLWLSGWYYVRFITVNKAAERKSQPGDWYPRVELCRNAALGAFRHFKNHKKLYIQYYQALDEQEQRDIMEEITFPNYLDSEKQDHQYTESDAFSSLKTYLREQLLRLSNRKDSVVRNAEYIRMCLTPTGMTLNEHFISSLRDFFPVEVLSQMPGEGSRSDKEFLEIGWLLNRYRRLWYSKRHITFLNFLEHRKQGLPTNFILRVKEAAEIIKQLCQHYQSLSDEYYKRLEKWQPDQIVIAQNTPSNSYFMETTQCGGKRKRETLEGIELNFSQENHESVEHHHLDESIQNVQSGSVVLDAAGPSAVVAMDVNGHTEEGGDHKPEQYICLEGVDGHTRLHQAELRMSSDEDSQWYIYVRSKSPKRAANVALPELDLNEPPPVIENATKRLDLDLNESPPIVENSKERLDLDLNEPPSEADNDSCLVDAKFVSSAHKNNQQLHHDAIEMDSVAPKRSKFTQSVDDHSRHSPNFRWCTPITFQEMHLRM